MPDIGPTTREEGLARLGRETFDLCVVGGGITGAGIALDAASRGLSVALLERGDFASGTSSKSSKLVHGGLRYLANYEFGLTWESVRERDLLRRIAPHLVRPVPFLYPVFRAGREQRFAGIGLGIYDLAAGRRGMGRHRRASAATIRELAPLLDPERPVASWTYWDARADDARLVFEIVRAATRFGAACLNYAGVEGFETRGDGRLGAARARDVRGGGAFEVRARAFVNAGGVWAGEVASLERGAEPPRLRPAKGVHVVVPASVLPLRAACIYTPAVRDRRSLFAVPWGPVVMIGTTDTEYEGPLDSPSVEAEDAAYVLDGTNAAFGLSLTPADAVAGFAGLRPLLDSGARRTIDLSRRHAITESAAGLLTITGGKLTTYRRMASDAVDRVCAALGSTARSRTHRVRLLDTPYPLLAAQVRESASALGLGEDVADELIEAHGDRAPSVLSLVAEDPALGAPVAPGLSTILAQVAFAFRAEMAVTLEDALARRTRLALRDAGGGVHDLAALARAAGIAVQETTAQAQTYAAALLRERGALAPAAR